MPSPNQIAVARLNRLIGTPDCPVIVDISIDPDFEADPYPIPGSFRHPHTVIPAFVSGGTLWATRHRPKIDRIACPWLIRRLVDPAARFLFVSPAEVAGVARKFNATPFDVESVHFSPGDALNRLATIIRGADTDLHDLAPQAAGLLALPVGLSRQYKDNQQQLTAGMALYDALYRWARDGFDEGHDWPAGRGA